jgi:hypothetical protein
MIVKYKRTELRRLPKRQLIEIILQQQEALFQLEVRVQTRKVRPIKTAITAIYPPASPHRCRLRICASPPAERPAASRGIPGRP